MRVEIRELEIELIPENEHERDAVVRIHKAGNLKVKSGRSTDNNWPPDLRQTNVILVFHDPNDYGR